MLKQIAIVVCLGFICMSLCGCFLLLAGAAGGAGTAVWLSGKISQEMNAPFDRTYEAAVSAMRSLRLEITEKTLKTDVAQIMGKYTDGKTIWIDIRHITDNSTKVEVRVGAVEGDQSAASKIIKQIQRYL